MKHSLIVIYDPNRRFGHPSIPCTGVNLLEAQELGSWARPLYMPDIGPQRVGHPKINNLLEGFVELVDPEKMDTQPDAHLVFVPDASSVGFTITLHGHANQLRKDNYFLHKLSRHREN